MVDVEDVLGGDEQAFSQEEVEKIIQEVQILILKVNTLKTIELYLLNQQYDEAKAAHWINQITEKIMEQLIELEKPFKYIINCLIMQKNGAGTYITTSCFWDTVADDAFNNKIKGTVSFQWPKDKQTKEQQKHTMQCIVTVFAISMIQQS